jgi:hypothetical protein
MERGYFFAGSPKSVGFGGNGTSDNMPRPLSELKGAPPLDCLRVLALVEQDRTFDDRYDGFRVIVANTCPDDVVFEAQDSRLEIVHEALDAAGKWRPIEYLPRSWCGNSYHQLTLAAGSFWEFVAPRYDGDLKTKLRIRVAVGESGDQHDVYSNEFLGRIHEAQMRHP